MKYELINPINSSYSVVEQVLTNRGIQLEDIEHYLHTTDDDILSPTLIDNVDEAIKIIIRHLNDNKKILVVVDSDCDGYTSSALLLNYLYKNFPSIVLNKIEYAFHNGKIHGINLDMVSDDVGLVIAPDSSSNDYDIHKQLYDKGIDVVVIDHHKADKVSEYACVVNNQLCNYPTKSLSGVAMVFKVLQRFDELCGFKNSEDMIDLVALGLIADMMSLHDFETRRLIEKGIVMPRNPFMKAIVKKQAFKLGCTAFDLSITPIGAAFYIAPLVNAVTRVGTLEEKRTLFESMLTWKAYQSVPSTKRGHKPGDTEQIVEQAIRCCTNIKNRQTKVRDANYEKIEALIKKDNLLERKLLLIKLEEFSIDRNLSGLVANELAAKYQRPVAILNKVINSKNEVLWEGSARGYDKFPVKDFRKFVRNSKCAFLAEGHPNAFGIGFTDEGFAQFVIYSEDKLRDLIVEPSYSVDFIWQANDIKPNDVLAIGGLENFWGQDVAEAHVAIEGINVTADKVFYSTKGLVPVMFINLPSGITCTKFKSSEEEYEEFASSSGCVTINLVGKCQLDKRGGTITPQINIESYEIVKRQQYYF